MPVVDDFKTFPLTLGDPVTDAAEVAPNDTADLSNISRALYVGVAGDIRVTLSNGTIVTFASMTAGWHPMRVARVHATGTTATHILGCW